MHQFYCSMGWGYEFYCTFLLSVKEGGDHLGTEVHERSLAAFLTSLKYKGDSYNTVCDHAAVTQLLPGTHFVDNIAHS